MLYIGVDLGTSAVKLLLMDGEGQIGRSFPENILSLFRIQAGQNRNRKTGGHRVLRESKS